MQKNRKELVKSMCLNALFAGIYFVLVWAIGDLSFGFSNGIISFRIAEIMIALCLFDKKYIFGAIIGCFCANLLSGQPIDIVVGTIQTVLSVCVLAYLKNKQLAIMLASLICGFIIGLEIYLLGFSAIGLWVILTTFIGELVMLEIGYLLFKRYKNVFSKKL